MRPCFHVEIVTPKKVVLNALLFGAKKPKRVFIWLHGLNSSMFSKAVIMDFLTDKETAVLAFNNRGHDKVSYIATTTKTKEKRGGGAHEVFAECVDDIDGAIKLVRSLGAKQIYLVGHSTGCQKSIYWASKHKTRVRGIILLAPVSDYAAALKQYGSAALAKAEKAARALVKKGKPHELLPETLLPWRDLVDAQRFLSLYTKDSSEEIFCYAQKGKSPSTLRKVKTPILALFAEHDEFADRSAADLAGWFLEHIYTGEPVIIPNVGHSFKGAEKLVAKEITRFATEF